MPDKRPLKERPVAYLFWNTTLKISWLPETDQPPLLTPNTDPSTMSRIMSDLPFIARSLWNHDHRDFTGKAPVEQALDSACIAVVAALFSSPMAGC